MDVLNDSTKSQVALLERTVDDYKSDTKPTWCPGCGDFGVLNAIYNALKVKGTDPKNIVAVSGIGCSSRLPFFVSSYGFHSIHGRAMPVSTGIRVANPDIQLVAFGGDGDGFAIGAGHFVHAARRNLNICYVIMDNNIYGLTKGQTSPTSDLGFVTKTTPKGSADAPLNPLMLALAMGATYVARGFSGKAKELAAMILQGMEHPGFAVIDVFSPCPTFNKVNTFKFYRDESIDLPEGYDKTDYIAALVAASKHDPYYLGVLYENRDKATFEDHVAASIPAERQTSAQVLDGLFKKFS